MSEAQRKPDTKSIDDVAQLLSQIVDGGSGPHQAAELTGEVSELLWAITDPDTSLVETISQAPSPSPTGSRSDV
jgi:hypothetical protein